MKKIIILLVLSLFMNCFAFDLYNVESNYQTNVSNSVEKNFQTNISNNIIEIIGNSLKNISLNDKEYIVLTAKNQGNGKLADFKIDWLNMPDEKANYIIQSLDDLPSLNNVKSEEITIYIGKKPQHDKTQGLNIIVYSIDKNTHTLKNNMQGYLMYFRTKLYLAWKTQNSKPISIYSKIDKNGNVIAYNVLNSSSLETDKKLLNAIKQTVSSIKPLSLKNDSLDMFISFGNRDEIIDKIVKNLEASFNDNFYALFEIKLDERANLVSANVKQSSNSEIVDNEILKAIKKTNNFSEIINFSNNEKTYYLSFRGTKTNQYLLDINYSDASSKIINWLPYLQEAEIQAKKNWQPPKSKEMYQVEAFVTIDKQGQIKDKKILKSSGNEASDNSVLKSIEQGIYPKLPEDFDGEVVPLELKFTYIKQPYQPSATMKKLKQNPWLHFYD